MKTVGALWRVLFIFTIGVGISCVFCSTSQRFKIHQDGTNPQTLESLENNGCTFETSAICDKSDADLDLLDLSDAISLLKSVKRELCHKHSSEEIHIARKPSEPSSLQLLQFPHSNRLVQHDEYQSTNGTNELNSQQRRQQMGIFDALMGIYQTFSGESWTSNQGWGSTLIPCCSWSGVFCSSCSQEDIRNNTCPVEVISLQTNNLNGDIGSAVPFFESLSSLSRIDLYENSVGGNLPELSHPNLIHLNLGRNRLTGTIPNFKQLPLLEQLYLEENRLSGTLPDFDNLPNLQLLSVGGGYLLTGEFPSLKNCPLLDFLFVENTRMQGNIPMLDQFPLMQFLWLQGNGLTGPVDLGKGSNLLQYVNLEFNEFTGSLPNLSLFPQLILFSVAFNQIEGTMSKNLTLPLMEEFYVDENYISGDLPNIDGWNALFSFGASFNQLEGSIFSCKNTPLLHNMYLDDNFITGPLSGVGDCPSLEQFVVAFNILTGTIPEFKSSPNLIYIIVSNNFLEGEIPSLSHLSQLTYFYGQKCNFSGNVPSFENLFELRSIILFNNNLKGSIPSFQDNNKLERVDLINNEVSGTLPRFDSLYNLRLLYLSSNNIEGTIPAYRNLVNLQQIAISDNMLEGTIPDFGDLRRLERITLYNNKLSGPIIFPRNLPQIQYIFLQNNLFSGPVPDFASISNAIEINLSSNKLSGTLPQLLSSSKLEVLDASGNQIEGSIPNFSNLASVRKLVLSRNRLTGTIDEFTNLPQLVEFSAHTNNLSGSVPLFRNCPLLEVIDLHNNRFSGSFPALSNEQIQHIDLSVNNLSGTIDPSTDIPNIKSLSISGNRMRGKIPRFFDRLDKLSDLDLSDNLFVGSMPETFWELPSLFRIDLSKNLFSGDVSWFISPKSGPTVLDFDYSYQYLYLDHNNLTGGLDWWLFAYIPQIQSLSLSHNLITEISEVPDLLEWKSLNVSFNPIRSPIPESFANLYKLEFLGMQGTYASHEGSRLLPQYLKHGDPYELKDKRALYLCPTVQSAERGGDLFVDLDPAYYQYVLCECLPNYFGFQDACLQCPSECDCSDGQTMRGCYASPSVRSVAKLTRCPVPDACEVSFPTDRSTLSDESEEIVQCKDGYGERVCSRCDDGYGLQGRLCVSCDEASTLATIVLAPIAVAGFIGLVVHFSTPNSGKLNIVVFHLQTLSILYTVFSGSRELAQLIDFSFSLGSINIPSISCVLGTTDAFSPLLFSYGRLVLLLIFGLSLHHYVSPSNRNKVIFVSLTLLHVMYYQTTQEVFGVFGCTVLDESTDRWYLNSVPWVQCSPASTEYLYMLAVTIPVFALFISVFPLFVWRIMKQIRLNASDRNRDERFGFLYLPFKEHRQFWELFILGRRISFSAATTIIPYTAEATLFLVLLIILQISIWMQYRYKPYRNEQENRMELWSLHIIFLSFFLALLGSYSPSQTWIVYLIMLINLALMIVFAMIFFAPTLLPMISRSASPIMEWVFDYTLDTDHNSPPDLRDVTSTRA
eukprot:TRINITY_DN1652_c0_g1_i20.p1 TRINITY_DN1652_c0_g1~~TRINITY_DN1652_c0_g1_i20.p1  ORF type:complete len:1505 (+),score=276.86 TRINITY_DN1652_c0_g1_i20:34-4548(+)